jgi:hypothetical protein
MIPHCRASIEKAAFVCIEAFAEHCLQNSSEDTDLLFFLLPSPQQPFGVSSSHYFKKPSLISKNTSKIN